MSLSTTLTSVRSLYRAAAEHGGSSYALAKNLSVEETFFNYGVQAVLEAVGGWPLVELGNPLGMTAFKSETSYMASTSFGELMCWPSTAALHNSCTRLL